MKIVGLMCVRDEADLLPQTYPHIRRLVDHIYAYDDGSQDATWDYVKHSDYAIRRVDDHQRLSIARPNYHHLLDKIKEDFGNEEVWVFITMGDRFFLNKTPRQLVEEAKDYEVINGMQLDFVRHAEDPWTEENDPWPDMSNIRHICRWFKRDERCTVGFKLKPHLTYVDAKYPWPSGLGHMKAQYTKVKGAPTSMEIPFLEHQGRRTPKASKWRHTSGSRPTSTRRPADYSTYESTVRSLACYYASTDVVPWIDNSSLVSFIETTNSGIEPIEPYRPLPPRKDC